MDPPYSMELMCTIRENHEDISARCTATLIKWHERDVDAGWQKLITALKILQLNVVAKTVEQFLQGELRSYLDMIC